MSDRFDRIRDLVLGAQEMPVDERSAWLQTACGGDDALQAEVESLLEHEQADESRLHTGGAIPTSLAMGPRTHREFGPYEILDVIGHGPTGTVFRARHRNSPQPEVALKALHSDRNAASVLHRFQATHSAVTAVQHSTIATFIGTATSDAGELAFVSEFIRGPRITDYADATMLTIRDRVVQVAQIADALRHAHRCGLTHGHLKPNNLLVTRHGGTAKPMLVDLGIAAAAHADLPDRGQAPLDDAAALGRVLFELLTGHRAPDEIPDRPSSQLRGADLEQLAHRRRTTHKAWKRALEGELDDIMMRSMSTASGEPTASMNEFAEELTQYLARTAGARRRNWRTWMDRLGA